MTRILVLVALGAAFLVPGAAYSRDAAHSATTTLVGDVGDGDAYTIGLTDESGNAVSHLDPGTYTIVVHDHSRLHNFHLTGPGVNESTGVSFVGDMTWTVTLAAGDYVYQCDPHRLIMYGQFSVGTPPPPAPAPTPLTATVTRRAISLVDAGGARVRSLPAGPYLITVRDRSRTDDFHLRGPGVNKATGVGARGTKRWAVTLSAGTYTYRSDRHKKLHGSFSVSS